jgi:hypothetical protein
VSIISVDMSQIAFNEFGAQVGIEIPADMLSEVGGANNNECGTGCQGSNNNHCGNKCMVESNEVIN